MSSSSTVYTVLAIWLLVVGALIYSAVTDIPYDGQILGWNPAAAPPEWASVRDAWDFANRVRTVPALLGFVLQTIVLRGLEPRSP